MPRTWDANHVFASRGCAVLGEPSMPLSSNLHDGISQLLGALGRDLVDLCGGDFQLDVDELRQELRKELVADTSGVWLQARRRFVPSPAH